MSVTYIQTTYRETFLLLLFLPLRHSQLPMKHFQKVGLGLQVGAQQMLWTLSVLSEETELAWGYCSRHCCKWQPVKGCVKELSHSISVSANRLPGITLLQSIAVTSQEVRWDSEGCVPAEYWLPHSCGWEQAKQSVEEGSSTIPMYTSWCLETACRCIERGNKTDCFHCKRQKKNPSQKSDHNAMLRSTLWHCLSCRFGLGKLFFQEAEPPVTYPMRSWSDCGPLCHLQGAWALTAPPLHWDTECHNYLAPTVSKRPWNSTQ